MYQNICLTIRLQVCKLKLNHGDALTRTIWFRINIDIPTIDRHSCRWTTADGDLESSSRDRTSSVVWPLVQGNGSYFDHGIWCCLADWFFRVANTDLNNQMMCAGSTWKWMFYMVHKIRFCVAHQQLKVARKLGNCFQIIHATFKRSYVTGLFEKKHVQQTNVFHIHNF